MLEKKLKAHCHPRSAAEFRAVVLAYKNTPRTLLACCLLLKKRVNIDHSVYRYLQKVIFKGRLRKYLY
jgi:hypothetical protein